MNFVVRPAGQVAVPNEMQTLAIGVPLCVCTTMAMPENTVFHVRVGLTKAKVMLIVVPDPTTSPFVNVLELEAILERSPKSRFACVLTVAVVGAVYENDCVTKRVTPAAPPTMAEI